MVYISPAEFPSAILHHHKLLHPRLRHRHPIPLAMERMLKARAGAARMTLMNTEDKEARDLISKVQAAAIVELAKQEPGLASLSADSRATLISMVSDAPWAQGDLVQVLHALAPAPAAARAKPKRMPLHVWSFATNRSSKQQQL